MPNHQVSLQHILGQGFGSVFVAFAVIGDDGDRPDSVEQIVDKDLLGDGLDRWTDWAEPNQMQRIPDGNAVLNIIQVSQPAIEPIARVDVEVTQHGVGKRFRMIQQQMRMGRDQRGDFGQVSKFHGCGP